MNHVAAAAGNVVKAAKQTDMNSFRLIFNAKCNSLQKYKKNGVSLKNAENL